MNLLVNYTSANINNFVLLTHEIILSCFSSKSTALELNNFSLFPDFGGPWSVQGLCSPVASQRSAMRAQVSFGISELPLQPEPTQEKLPPIHRKNGLMETKRIIKFQPMDWSKTQNEFISK